MMIFLSSFHYFFFINLLSTENCVATGCCLMGANCELCENKLLFEDTKINWKLPNSQLTPHLIPSSYFPRASIIEFENKTRKWILFLYIFFLIMKPKLMLLFFEYFLCECISMPLSSMTESRCAHVTMSHNADRMSFKICLQSRDGRRLWSLSSHWIFIIHSHEV